jgi:hypothetical protein
MMSAVVQRHLLVLLQTNILIHYFHKRSISKGSLGVLAPISLPDLSR